jgi:hypothetical protein
MVLRHGVNFVLYMRIVCRILPQNLGGGPRGCGPCSDVGYQRFDRRVAFPYKFVVFFSFLLCRRHLDVSCPTYSFLFIVLTVPCSGGGGGGGRSVIQHCLFPYLAVWLQNYLHSFYVLSYTCSFFCLDVGFRHIFYNRKRLCTQKYSLEVSASGLMDCDAV